MKYNDLQMSTHKDRKRVGRGIAAGGGKTAGRGTKGQNARTGKKLRPMFQGGQNGIATAVPKSRGFKSLRTPAQVVYLDRLEGLKGIVDNYALYEANLIATPFHTVKVIARGELGSKITLKTQGASRNVVAAIEKAGGSFDKVATPIQKSAKEAEATDKK
ncbi:ribosomal protein L15 [Candidatus Saccharimonas aalborgensis]|uniref:Large ribosomal subunit protein uL15 n=1 Tax=Candidatus Saccharimonas aalborgensis TaxID=1332188 RepID=R4PY57_9BACT|nr:50S ribosomal protein L15 [Candidatus Saccharimonas aalborgensis]AGL62702.1 ribosomal protein L15 [Candidatus Saccharimonas aalborgensis]QQS68202.1 MAG: 50S ribosomal protein L15 [Candidatus Saccharibacteria bacterium]QQS70525.1 MAG: 50S ribosomal protein L15 [Candidatus Saccharibacteria bacterium]